MKMQDKHNMPTGISPSHQPILWA